MAVAMRSAVLKKEPRVDHVIKDPAVLNEVLNEMIAGSPHSAMDGALITLHLTVETDRGCHHFGRTIKIKKG